MHFLGEYYRRSTVYFELTTKNRHGVLIAPDTAPSAIIETFDPHGVAYTASISMTQLATGKFFGSFRVPDEALYGDYVITYYAAMNGTSYTTKERFVVSELFRLIENTHNTANALQIDLGNPSVEGTNLHLLIKQLVVQHLPYENKVKVTNYTLKTDEGLNTTVILNGTPAKNVIVNVMFGNSPFNEMARTTTNEKGEWAVELTPGYYRFDFVHPNGMLLKTLRKQVG